MSLEQNLERVLARYEELQSLMSTNEPPPAEEIARLAKEFSDLTPVVTAVNELKSVQTELEELESLLADETDGEMRELAEAERGALHETLPKLARQVELMLLPKDEADTKNAILEVRAGTGGDEAALFVGWGAMVLVMASLYPTKDLARLDCRLRSTLPSTLAANV